MQSRNLHLTLAFLGDSDATQLPAMTAAAGLVRVVPFEIQLDRCGFWKQGRQYGILWAGGEAPPQLDALAAGLRARLSDAGVTFDAKPFVPHVTLLRDARPPQATIEFAPVRWSAHDFVLVASERDAAGPVYRAAAGPFGNIG